MNSMVSNDFKDDDDFDETDGPCVTLSSPHNGFSVDDTLEHLATLESAIQNGNVTVASAVACQLAKKRTALCVKADASSCKLPDNYISVTIHIEDKAGPKLFVVWRMRPSITIHALKWKMYYIFGFSPNLQKWIIGRRSVSDNTSLADCGIESDSSAVFLYLRTPAPSSISIVPDPLAVGNLSRQQSDVTQRSSFSSVGSAHGERLPARAFNLITESVGDVQVSSAKTPLVEQEVKAEQVGWECPVCTFINEPTRPGCEQCSTDRPDHYQPPAGYQPSERERRRLLEEQKYDQEVRRLALDMQQARPQSPMYYSGGLFNHSQSFPSAEHSLTFNHLRYEHGMSDEELAWELQRQEDLLASLSATASYLDHNVEYG